MSLFSRGRLVSYFLSKSPAQQRWRAGPSATFGDNPPPLPLGDSRPGATLDSKACGVANQSLRVHGRPPLIPLIVEAKRSTFRFLKFSGLALTSYAVGNLDQLWRSPDR